jgi:rhodanese-related sulfurtransferase
VSLFSHGHTPAVDPAGAFDLLAAGAALVDVREMDEWQAGHAPQAIHIPLSQLGTAAGSPERATPLVVICRSGRRSDHAVSQLCSAGFQAFNLAGGMHAWQQAGGAVVREDGTPGTVI